MRQRGAEVRRFGLDFAGARERAREFAEEARALFVEAGRDPAIAEGAGTIAVELCRWPKPFAFFLVPLGDGALASGIGRWMKAHSPTTRVIAVCPAGAPAMALSLREGKAQSTESIATIADGIAVRIPVPESLSDLEGVVYAVFVVDDR